MLRRSSAAFLQGVLTLIGFGALAFLLWEPHIEGRNATATVIEVYFYDPFLAYAYVASIPFFVGLYHGFQFLGHAGKSQVFSPAAVISLRTIKRCSIAMIGFVAVGEMFILMNDSEDRAGGVFMGVMIAFCSIIVATASAMFEHILQKAVDLKTECELTVQCLDSSR